MSASVSSRILGSRARASAMPCRTAHSLPSSRRGGSPGRGHGQRQPAVAVGQLTGQVPGAVRAAVVDEEDLRPARDSPGPAATAGSPGSTAASSRAGTTTHDVRPAVAVPRGGGSRTSVRQKKPWPSSSHSQAASDPAAVHAMALTRRSLPHRRRRPRGAIVYRGRVKIALMDSGIGLLAGRRRGTAAAARRGSGPLLRPRRHALGPADPGGPHRAGARRRRAAAAHRPDALIVGCNTASVHALPALRAQLEPGCRSSAPSRRSSPPRPAAAPSPSGPPPPPPAAPTSAGSSATSPTASRSPRCPAPASPTPWSTPTSAADRRRRRRGRRADPGRRDDRRPRLHPLRTGRRAHPRRRPARPAARRSSCTAPPAPSPPRRCAASASAAEPGPPPTGALTVLLSGREARCPPPARPTRKAGCSRRSAPRRLTAAPDRADRADVAVRSPRQPDASTGGAKPE